MPESLVTALISSVAILIGAIIGATCSWVINNNTTSKNIEVQTKIVKENRELEEKLRRNKLSECANIVRLDICTAIFQSIRIMYIFKLHEQSQYPTYVPINKEYSKAIACLTSEFNLKEISYIYQLYGIIEKINYDIRKIDYSNFQSYKNIEIDIHIFLIKLYGERYIEFFNKDIDKLTYIELFDNEFTKNGYKLVLKKLDKICKFS